MRKREARTRLIARIAERWPVKVLSIVAALLLFIFHRLGNIEERFFSVPLKLEINNNLVPSSSYARAIKVSLRGDATSIFTVAEGDVEAYLDLTVYNDPAFVKVPVRIRRTGTALDAENLEITVDPMEVSLELDRKADKPVAVVPDFLGSPEKGYELVRYTLQPDTMIIEGPLKLINTVSELRTETIDLRNRSAGFTQRLRVVNGNSLVAIRGDEIVEFTGVVDDSILIRNFDNIPITVTGLRGNRHTAALEPASGAVRLEAASRLLEHLELPEPFLVVDVSGLETGSHTLPVQAELPPGFTLSRQEPLEVTVHIGDAP